MADHKDWSAQRWAIEISRLWRPAAGKTRFPVDVEAIAPDLSAKWFASDPVRAIEGGSLPNFEGALYPLGDPVTGWTIIYNRSGVSVGRKRYGATSFLFATDVKTPGTHDTQIAGVIAFYPYCYDNVVPSPPTLILIGEKDDWTPAGMCQAIKGNANFDVVVYPGASHAFAMPMGEPIEALGGHHLAFDEKAALDAQQRTDAFMDAHMK